MINTQITRSSFFQNICIILIWITALYSAIIQYMLFQVPYGMVIFGIAILATFILANNTHKFNCIEMLTEESIYMGIFMIYMLLSGLLFSPNREDHISQWITCIEYLFIQIVISSIIKNTKTYKFHYLLFVEALIISIIIMAGIQFHQKSTRMRLELHCLQVYGLFFILIREKNIRIS